MRTQGFFRRVGWLALSAALLFVLACAVEKKGIDTASGGDHKRDLAKMIPLDRSVTDSVSAPKGDHTDWKYINVREEGDLVITVSVDTPTVMGTILVTNELGEPIERRMLNARDQTYEVEIPVEPGKYFVRMGVSKFETVYSVGNRFKKREAAAVVIMQPEETPRAVRRTTPTARPRKDPVAAPEVEEDPTKIVVTTTILNVVPWKEGKASRITFKQGASQGIKRGATVAISSGGSCIVKEVFDAASVCFVDKAPEAFKEGTRVVITSDR